jgi:3-methylcrotonyl-CoA carboxylase alpha subunit
MRASYRDGDRVRAVELVPLGNGRWRATVDGATFELSVEPIADGRMRLVTDAATHVAEVTVSGERRFVRLDTLEFVLDRERDGRRKRGAAAGGGLEAPMPGVVTRVFVAPGDEVTKGQPLVALEAMKMEHVIRAPRDGRVRAVPARAGEMVGGGVALVELEDAG